MVAYNFQPRFASLVESGEKRQTIRPEGKRVHAKPGDTVHLFTGMRTRNCRKLGEAVCIISEPIVIDTATLRVGVPPGFTWRRSYFAIQDGFKDWEDLLEWFRATHGLPFIGRLIQWAPLA